MEDAWKMMLQTAFPSWLYPVTQGATTIWEHWDGMKDDGSMWSADMNSFNHYARWRSARLGIRQCRRHLLPARTPPAMKKSPSPRSRTPGWDWLSCSYQSRFGMIRSEWKKQDGMWRYEIETPVNAVITIDGQTHTVGKGRWIYFSKIR